MVVMVVVVVLVENGQWWRWMVVITVEVSGMVEAAKIANGGSRGCSGDIGCSGGGIN